MVFAFVFYSDELKSANGIPSGKTTAYFIQRLKSESMDDSYLCRTLKA